jgi:hypothetical protein
MEGIVGIPLWFAYITGSPTGKHIKTNVNGIPTIPSI